MRRDWGKISTRGLCMDLLKNLWMILLAGASLWLAATGWHNLTYEPAYTASATLVVGVKGQTNTYSSLATATQMNSVFSQVFQSDALRSKIIEEVGEDIQGTLSCSAIAETNLMTLQAASPSPRQAYLFIQSALEHYEEVAGNVFANAYLQVVQEPEVPQAPSNTSWVMRYRTHLTLLGAAGMAALICLFYALRFTVKSLESAAEQLDGEIRGVIPFERKRGGLKRRGRNRREQALLLNSPLVTMDFAEASRRVETKVEYHMRRQNYKTLLVVSVAENEGKSTVAANLALALAEKHKKVLLVDGDLRKPSQHKIFEEDAGERESLESVLTGEADWRRAVFHSRKNHIWELFQFKGVSEAGKALERERLAGLVKAWSQEMDYVIVDCSPAMVSTDAEVWMGVVDSVLLVVREDWADVRAINDTVDIIWQNETDFTGFVLNGFHREWFHSLGNSGYDGYEGYRKRVDSVRERG